MKNSFIFKALILVALVATPSAAQDDLMRQQRVRAGQDGTIQSSITMNLPLDADKDIEAQHEQALRKIYATAGRSCPIVLEAVASLCEVASITSSVRSDESGARSNRITVSAQILMRVTFRTDTRSNP